MDDFILQMIGAGTGTGAGTLITYILLKSILSRQDTVEARVDGMESSCPTKMKGLEDCFEGEVKVLQAKVDRVGSDVQKLIMVISLTTDDPAVRDILKDGTK